VYSEDDIVEVTRCTCAVHKPDGYGLFLSSKSVRIYLFVNFAVLCMLRSKIENAH